MEEVKKRWYGKPTSYEEVADGTAGVPDRTTELRQLWQQSQVKRKEQGKEEKDIALIGLEKKGTAPTHKVAVPSMTQRREGKENGHSIRSPSLSPDRKPNDTGKHTNTNESTRTTRQVTWVLLLILAQEHFRPKNTRETCESS